jgi:hypothetical protein
VVAGVVVIGSGVNRGEGDIAWGELLVWGKNIEWPRLWEVCDMDDGVLVRLKDIELDVVVYEVPTSGGMMAVLPSGTLGMCLESVIGGTVLNQGFGDVVVYHRIIFSGYDSLVGWVWSDCVEEV